MIQATIITIGDELHRAIALGGFQNQRAEDRSAQCAESAKEAHQGNRDIE